MPKIKLTHIHTQKKKEKKKMKERYVFKYQK